MSGPARPRGSGAVYRVFVDGEDAGGRAVPVTAYPCEPVRPEPQPPSDLALANETQAISGLASQIRQKDRRLVHSDNSKLWNAWTSHHRICAACSKAYIASVTQRGAPGASLFCIPGLVRYTEFSIHCKAVALAGK